MGAPHFPASKPGRSEADEALDPHDQWRITEQVRRKFEAEVPPRHAKPDRSDPNSSDSAVEVLMANVSASPSPEFLKFQSLIQDSMTQPLLTEFQNLDFEEFVATDYYKDLSVVYKTLHHTTGSGFIQLETSPPDDTSVANRLKMNRPPYVLVRAKSHSNPATNDWIPSMECTPHIDENLIATRVSMITP